MERRRADDGGRKIAKSKVERGVSLSVNQIRQIHGEQRYE